MNIENLIMSLQQAASAATTSRQLMTLSKTIEKLNVGNITSVAGLGSLPTNLTTNGNVYYVASEEDLYYNVGSTWKRFYNFSTTAYGWGRTDAFGYGGIGDGTTSSRSSPVTVIGGITNWVQASAGNQFSLGLSSSGTLYAWGRGTYGSLGTGTTLNQTSPVTIAGGITNWTQVSAGMNFSLALTSSGIAYAWGQNTFGRLGDNTSSNRSSPVTIVGGITNWTQLSAGQHSLGLTSSGIVYAWGANNYGQLGNNTTISSSSPVTIVGGITTWNQISAGGVGHSLATTGSGTAYAWGANDYGRLGDNSTSSRSSPVTIVGGITNWLSLSAGYRHSLGLTFTGIAYAWGRNYGDGRLGDNTTSNRSSPVTVVGGITNWNQLSGGYHSLGTTSNGIAYGWGPNPQGQLGDNTTSNRSSPVTVVGGITNWSQVSASRTHSQGLTTTIL